MCDLNHEFVCSFTLAEVLDGEKECIVLYGEKHKKERKKKNKMVQFQHNLPHLTGIVSWYMDKVEGIEQGGI